MRALRMTRWNHDPELQEIPAPDPGPGEVVIAIGGAGACHSDLHLLYEFPEGAMPWHLPITLGHENAGWVHTLGAGVTGFEVGQPVAVYGPWGCGRCHACAAGHENYCRTLPLGSPVGGLGADGGMAELMLVPHVRHLVPLPENLAPANAAPLTDGALTPYHGINRARHLLVPGNSAVVIGVGGLGHLAVQLLRATTGCQVIAIDTRDEALALATDSGADHAVRADEDTVATIRDLTHGHGADVVLDVVGSDPTLATAARIVSVEGHIGLLGLGGGSLPVSWLGMPYGVTVTPTYWGTLPEFHEVLHLAARGDVTTRVSTYPLEQATDAYAALRAGQIVGRAVVVP